MTIWSFKVFINQQGRNTFEDWIASMPIFDTGHAQSIGIFVSHRTPKAGKHAIGTINKAHSNKPQGPEDGSTNRYKAYPISAEISTDTIPTTKPTAAI